jgi:hypothetical protein
LAGLVGCHTHLPPLLKVAGTFEEMAGFGFPAQTQT